VDKWPGQLCLSLPAQPPFIQTFCLSGQRERTVHRGRKEQKAVEGTPVNAPRCQIPRRSVPFLDPADTSAAAFPPSLLLLEVRHRHAHSVKERRERTKSWWQPKIPTDTTPTRLSVSSFGRFPPRFCATARHSTVFIEEFCRIICGRHHSLR